MRAGVLAALLAAAGPAAASQPPVIHAVRASAPIVLDGRLDEAAWRDVPIFTSFIQQVPVPRAPATDRTEVMVVFTDSALYVGVRAFQSAGVPIVANELQRDAGRMHERNDTFTLALDTFADRRNGYVFYFNPLGAQNDWACWDEGRVWSQEWNTIWDVRTSIEPWGWSAEMWLPFRSLRFAHDGPQRWGINFRRIVLAKNEWTFATFIPPEWGTSGIGKFSSGADLEGVEIGGRPLNMELHPYALAGAVEDTCADACDTHGRGDVGIDAKYGISPNLTLDLTWNTDFSQVEADEQQINLSRFSLFFPEKRQFFLEGKGIFDFGITSGDYRVLPFFSRRIGLDAGQPTSIVGGARLTGKVGAYSVGALEIATDGVNPGDPLSVFSVARVRRDILQRSSIGVIAVDRRDALGRNETLGGDAHFAFGRSSRVESFLVRSWSPDNPDDAWAGRLHGLYDVDTYAIEGDYVRIGRNYDPRAGYVRRTGIERWYGRVQRSPRLSHGPVRKVYAGASYDYVRDGERLESRTAGLQFKMDLSAGDVVQLDVDRLRDAPDQPFVVAGGPVVPAGVYTFHDVVASWLTAPSRRLSGRIQARAGGYYGGTRREMLVTSIVKASSRLYTDLNLQVTDLDLPGGSTVARLVGTRVTFSASTRAFYSALLQWNSTAHQLDANLRLSWMYTPGSYLYVVYSRSAPTISDPRLQRSHSVVVKATRLLRF
jgi:hypothetical protein